MSTARDLAIWRDLIPRENRHATENLANSWMIFAFWRSGDMSVPTIQIAVTDDAWHGEAACGHWTVFMVRGRVLTIQIAAPDDAWHGEAACGYWARFHGERSSSHHSDCCS